MFNATIPRINLKYEKREPIIMAKNANDVILRDRLQCTTTAAGDIALVYGRIDLSSYVNPVEKKGMRIKQILVQPHSQSGSGGDAPASLTNTGSFVNARGIVPFGGSTDAMTALKIFASTRAYQSGVDVGIASPDVCYLREYVTFTGLLEDPVAGYGLATNVSTDVEWTPDDLHPDGFSVVSDLLIGVCADNLNLYGDATLELDIMIIAEPVTISQKDLTNLLTQAQDL